MVSLLSPAGGGHQGFTIRSRWWHLGSMVWMTWLAVTFGIQAQGPLPDAPLRHVDDAARLLRPETFSRLDQRLVDLERTTGTQMVVYVTESLPSGEELEDYVRRVFNAWKIGERSRNNGILFAVFVKDRRMRIEVGSGLSQQVPNSLAARILRDAVTPRFRALDYDGGVVAGVDGVLHALHAQPVHRLGTGTHRHKDLSTAVEGFMILAGLAGAVAGLAVRAIRTRNEPTGTQVLHAILGGILGGVGHALAVYAGTEYHWAAGIGVLLIVWLFLGSRVGSGTSQMSGWDYSGSGWGSRQDSWWNGWGWGSGWGNGITINFGGGSDSSFGSSDSGWGGGGGDSGFSGGGGSSDGGGASGSW